MKTTNSTGILYKQPYTPDTVVSVAICYRGRSSAYPGLGQQGMWLGCRETNPKELTEDQAQMSLPAASVKAATSAIWVPMW